MSHAFLGSNEATYGLRKAVQDLTYTARQLARLNQKFLPRLVRGVQTADGARCGSAETLRLAAAEVYETVVLGQHRYRTTFDGGTGYRHRGTISKAIASRKLSATRREDGSWAIDCAELARYLDVNGLMGVSSDTS
jgi:hypothetical protein